MNDNFDNDEGKIRKGNRSRTKAMDDRVKALWALLRSKYVKKMPNIIDLLTSATVPIPYILTLKQGFQFKYRFRSKYQFKCVVMHPRVPWHDADGHIRGINDIKDEDNEGDVQSKDKHATDEEEEQSPGSKKIKKSSQITFVAADTSKTVRIWDVTRTTTGKPRAVVKVGLDIYQFVFISRYSMYVSCCDDKAIRVEFCT